ncbi:hypothetical protein CLOP_g14572 [Closterium sp. NIES-67]|nr:hypothetical protein CLOP_g14572 [Closterium sp. NIES-67]
MQLGGAAPRYHHLTNSHILAISPTAAELSASFPSQPFINASSFPPHIGISHNSCITRFRRQPRDGKRLPENLLRQSNDLRQHSLEDRRRFALSSQRLLSALRRSRSSPDAVSAAAASFAETDAGFKEGSSPVKFAGRPLLRDAIIVGGGIAGLTAAIALRQQGVDVQVYERAEGRDPERVGRMVGVQPNGLAALACIDRAIADALSSRGAHVPSLCLVSPSGDLLLESTAPADGRLSIRWGLVLDVLLSFLPDSCVHQGCEFTGQVQQANGRVMAHFTRHGQPFTAEADLLIGTDGVRSAVRQHVLREGEERERWGAPRDSGRTMWLGAAPRETVAFQHSRPFRTCFTRGGGRTAAVGDLGRVEIFVLFVCADEQGRGLTEQQSRDGEEVRAKLRALFDDWPAYREVIEVVPPDMFLERRVLDVPLLPRWRNGRILVFGDAAHAVPPTLGQGSSMAMEDALELARQVVMDHPSLEAALDAFEAERAPRVAWVAEASAAVAGQAYSKDRDPNAPAEESVNPEAAFSHDRNTSASSNGSGGNSNGNSEGDVTYPISNLYNYERLRSPLLSPPWASKR